MNSNPSARARILVVDDMPENRHLVTRVLERAGHEVLSAGDGATALELARRALPSLILLDVRMPDMDGYEVCAHLKRGETTRAIPVIFISALDEPEAQTIGFDLGAADYITKPINVAVLLARVHTHLELYQQRRSLEGMFRDVIEFAPDAFVLADLQGVILQVNACAEGLFGYRRSALVGQPLAMLLPTRERAGYARFLATVPGRDGPMRPGTQVHGLRHDGSEFPADLRISPLQTDQGRVILAVVRDMTERVLHEEQLRKAARYARSLIETSIDPLVLIDLGGRVQDANEAACRVTGYSRERLIGSDAARHFTEPDRLSRGFQRVMAEGQVIDYELSIRHASGRTIDVLCNARAFRNDQGEVVGLFAAAHDVTESRRIQHEISTSRQRLREMAAQSEAMLEYERKNIAREVHDELGQVLTALRMDLTVVKMLPQTQTAELQDKLQEMRGLIDRAIQGVRNVAANLRPTALDMGLVPALEWLCADFARRTGIPCALQADAHGGDLAEDRAIALFRIVQESLTNVARYAEARQVEVELQFEQDTLQLTVCDDGCGFEPRQLGEYKSFGLLGMQERALALGGAMQIDSAPGRGTCIRVNVPMRFASLWQAIQ